MKALQTFTVFVLVTVCFACLTPVVLAQQGVPVAVFPLQDLSEGRHGVDLQLTDFLSERLAASGNNIIGLDAVIAFMAASRIRTVGHLETYYIAQGRKDLDAAFVLLGTITHRGNVPEPSIGLVLNLVRTSDIRTVWTYIGSLSISDEVRPLGIGQPASTVDLADLLINDVLGGWPWEIINEVQKVQLVEIDTSSLEPRQVRPGYEVNCRVRLRETWSVGNAPKVYFKADDQLYPATVNARGNTFSGTWLAGEKNGRYMVTMVLEWPLYERTEETILGFYVVDGVPPLFEIRLVGSRLINGVPGFRGKLGVIPRLLLREPLSRWRFALYPDDGSLLGEMRGEGNLPESFVWSGADQLGKFEDGTYDLVVEIWDLAGNSSKVTERVGIYRKPPSLGLTLERDDKNITVGFEPGGKLPLESWEMEMWTDEGTMLIQEEGEKLPVTIKFKLPDDLSSKKITGYVLLRDIMGNTTRKSVEELLPHLQEQGRSVKKQPAGTSEGWVDQF